MNIYLDDCRQTPVGYLRTCHVQDTITMLKHYQGCVDILSLDHDLGVDYETGYDVLLWVEEQLVVHGRHPPKSIVVHSSNPSARVKMELAIQSINNKRKQKNVDRRIKS